MIERLRQWIRSTKGPIHELPADMTSTARVLEYPADGDMPALRIEFPSTVNVRSFEAALWMSGFKRPIYLPPSARVIPIPRNGSSDSQSGMSLSPGGLVATGSTVESALAFVDDRRSTNDARADRLEGSGGRLHLLPPTLP